MAGGVEVGVVDPHRASTPVRRPHQPLPQARDGPDPPGQHPLRRLDVERRTRIVHDQGAEMLGHRAAALHREQREIRRARPFDGDHPPRHLDRARRAARRMQREPPTPTITIGRRCCGAGMTPRCPPAAGSGRGRRPSCRDEHSSPNRELHPGVDSALVDWASCRSRRSTHLSVNSWPLRAHLPAAAPRARSTAVTSTYSARP
jgi:hypothetical protein